MVSSKEFCNIFLNYSEKSKENPNHLSFEYQLNNIFYQNLPKVVIIRAEIPLGRSSVHRRKRNTHHGNTNTLLVSLKI